METMGGDGGNLEINRFKFQELEERTGRVHREGRGHRVAVRPAGEYRNASIRPSGARVTLPPFAEF